MRPGRFCFQWQRFRDWTLRPSGWRKHLSRPATSHSLSSAPQPRYPCLKQRSNPYPARQQIFRRTRSNRRARRAQIVFSMDYILEFFDEQGLDHVWAALKPMRLPLDGLSGVENATTALRSLNKEALLQTTSSLAAAATGTYETLPHSDAYNSNEEQSWITVSAWPRDDWRRQFISVRFLCRAAGFLTRCSSRIISYALSQ